MNKHKRKFCSGGYYNLEGGLITGTLMKIRTSKCKELTKEEIKKAIIDDKSLQDIEKYESLINKLLDIAIVIYLSKGNYTRQDVDNIAKVVLDGLKEELLNDDSQIIRLLVYKKENIEIEDAETFQIGISVREHNPLKEMVLENVGPYSEEEL